MNRNLERDLHAPMSQKVPSANYRTIRGVSILLVMLTFLVNLGVNDIWMPNESFYADAVREMLRTNNFLDIYFNGELRFNKPPVTYWAMALSAWLLGLDEFSLRLPIALMALGTILYTKRIADLMYGKEVGWLSAAAMAFSIQFFFTTRYASPETPLAFFFTLTLYHFLKAYQQGGFLNYAWFYISLGLTVLTKGFPYYVVIGGIAGLFVLLDQKGKWPLIWNKVLGMYLWWGVPLAIGIGMSWITYAWLTFGEQFTEVYQHETTDRAFDWGGYTIRDVFYYIEVNLWAMLPYSLVSFFALIVFARQRQKVSLLLSWTIVMFVVFTIAQGKLPTYWIQAAPALSILSAYFLVHYQPKTKIQQRLWYISLGVPAFLMLAINMAMVYLTDVSPIWWALHACPLVFLILYYYFPSYISRQVYPKKVVWSYFPFYIFLTGMLMLNTSVLGKFESLRPYEKIGAVVQQEVPPSVDTPIYMQEIFLHNMSYYAHRRGERCRGDRVFEVWDERNKKGAPFLALVKEKDLARFSGVKTLWKGYIYIGSSESRFFLMARDNIRAWRFGNYKRYQVYHLVYKPGG
ncbi:glycosyltransferase family 39 protein [Algivirga pacifica]|uniref:Glycosyltransferase family 39 protein n=1 Tax=Algivirga pacifica TaxID=1162670 RepID=A0ABP9DKK1_9BACT